ncbi:hypothetical protein BaRGS_00006964, partial [Batillaria attramentaria]
IILETRKSKSQQTKTRMLKIAFTLAVILSNAHQTASNVVVMRIKGDNYKTLSQTVDVRIDLDGAAGFTGPKFVGVAIDASFFREKWKYFDVYSKTVKSLAQGLSPSFLRMGGTAADFLIFNATAPGAKICEICESDVSVERQDKNFTMSGVDWERLNYLVETASWDLIFDINVFLRKGNVWDPDNARKIFQFSQERGYKIPCFQLGNEPNAYYHDFKINITSSQMVNDMQILRSVLSEFTQYRNSCIVGPEVTKVTKGSGRDYLEGFLQAGGQNIVAAATLHHYYFNVETKGASVSDFVNATILDSLNEELQIGTSIVHRYGPSLPVWLSETSSVSGGGLAGVSNGYAAGFMWLDKLGLSALYGLRTVIRQTFYHGNYALIGDDLTPNPDYFLTVLYKRLVQGPVLRVQTSGEMVRIYAHCSNPDRYSRGAMTVYALNLHNEPVTLNLSQFRGQTLHLYMLVPGDHHGLRSKFVALNGKRLEMVDHDLPPMPPEVRSGPVTMAPYSFGFIVIPQADVKICQS